MQENGILSSIVKHQDKPGATSFMLNGESHAAAIVEAVIFLYDHITGRPEVTFDQLTAIAAGKAKVTILQRGETMFGAKLIKTQAGTLFTGSRGIGILPKGSRTKGYQVKPESLLDIELGYAGERILAERLQSARAYFPDLEPLTQERLNALPDRGENCTLAVLGTVRLPDFSVPGCLWFIHSYMKEEDIAEGCIIVPPSEAVSEHGSILGRHLMSTGGAVTKAIDIPFGDVLKLTNAKYEDALKLVK